jgi:hypothetical protein
MRGALKSVSRLQLLKSYASRQTSGCDAAFVPDTKVTTFKCLATNSSGSAGGIWTPLTPLRPKRSFGLRATASAWRSCLVAEKFRRQFHARSHQSDPPCSAYTCASANQLRRGHRSGVPPIGSRKSCNHPNGLWRHFRRPRHCSIGERLAVFMHRQTLACDLVAIGSAEILSAAQGIDLIAARGGF